MPLPVFPNGTPTAARPWTQQIGGEAHALSGGEERRLDLARTLWRQGSLVMLDEPAAGLDEKTRVELEKQIAQLPCDILIVAMHNYSPEFLDSFTKVLRIRDGELATVNASVNAIRLNKRRNNHALYLQNQRHLLAADPV